MRDEDKTKEQLLFELRASRQKIVELQRSKAELENTGKDTQDMLDFWQMLIDNIPSSIFYQDARGIYRGCNKAYEAFLGRSKEEIVGRSVCEVFPEDLADKYREMDSALFQQPARQVYEWQITHADGSRHDVIFNKASYLNADGRVAGLVAVMVDITERKRAEEELREAKQQTETILSELPVAVAVTRIEDGTFLYVNKTFEKLFGYCADELIGRTSIEIGLYAPEDRMRLVSTVKEKGVAHNVELKLRSKNGMQLETLTSTVPFFYQGKDCMLNIVVDVSEQKRIERHIREQDERLRVIFEISQTGIILVSPQGVITFANQRMADMFGCTLKELIGSSYPDHLHPDEKKAGDERMRKLIAGEIDSVYTERHYQRRDGGDFWGLLSGCRHEAEDGSLISLVGVIADITERKLMEEALRKSEEQHRTLIENSPIGIYRTTVGAEGGYLAGNPAFLNMFGFDSLEELKPLTAAQRYMDPSERKIFSDRLLAQESISVEHRLKKKDGTPIWGSITARVVRGEDGKALYFDCSMVDISERKRAEEAQTRLQTQLANALEMAHLGHWEYDVATDLFTFNDHFYKIFRTTASREGGYTMSSAEYCSRFVHPEDRHVVGEETRKAIETSDPHFSRQLEHRMLYDDGTVGYISVRFSIVKDERGRTINTYGVNQDITERKRAEETLRESEQRFRELFDNMSSGVAIYDSPDDGQSFVFRDLNKAGLKYGQKTKDEVIGREVRTVFPGVEELGLFEVFKRVWKTGRPEQHPSSIYKDENLELWVDNYVCKLPSGQIVAIYEDKTAQKMMEQAKERLEKELRHAHKMEAVGTLAGGIAHEFNNILGIVLGNAELAADDIPDWNPARFNLDEIKSASLRARDVVRQLLTFSRKAEENRRILDLAPVIKEAIKLLRSSIPTNIEFRLDIADECHKVFADPTQMHQVLLNLGTNAAHAMEVGGGILEFSLRNATSDQADQGFDSSLAPGEYVMLKVRDTGHGIPSEYLERIFDPYFTTKEIGKGTGMGLAVVHGIVESHGGSIRVKSGPGEGTTFEILYPASRKEPRPIEETKQELPTGTERILFVDDEKSIAALGGLMLERLGYQVQSETDPRRAMEVFASSPEQFDLVITDMTMPEITGDQLIEQVLRIRPDMKTILCTGYSQRVDEESARSMGAKAYALKPLDRKQLAITVRKVLDGGT